jgi:hypothetical protein
MFDERMDPFLTFPSIESDTSRGLSARGAGAVAAELNVTTVIESQRAAQATIGEWAGVEDG